MVEPNDRELLFGAAMAVARAQPVEGSNRLVVEDSPDPADLALLEEHVAAAAVAAAGVGAEQEFGIFLRDDDGRVLAGISGIVWVGTASCQAMRVDESLRGRGLAARALVAGAEHEARRRGCALVVFHAYDLLPPGLYERLGYETVGVIKGLSSRQRSLLVPQ